MANYSVCGIDCDTCKKCDGCRVVAPNNKCLWGSGCDLYNCVSSKSIEHCGKCSEFPCSTLKEWAAGENPERIDNLQKI